MYANVGLIQTGPNLFGILRFYLLLTFIFSERARLRIDFVHCLSTILVRVLLVFRLSLVSLQASLGQLNLLIADSFPRGALVQRDLFL